MRGISGFPSFLVLTLLISELSRSILFCVAYMDHRTFNLRPNCDNNCKFNITVQHQYLRDHPQISLVQLAGGIWSGITAVTIGAWSRVQAPSEGAATVCPLLLFN